MEEKQRLPGPVGRVAGANDRKELIKAVERYIDKRLCNIDEDIIDVMDGAEARAAARALA